MEEGGDSAEAASTQSATAATKETVAVAAPRQNLVDLAIKFLSNPRVMERSVEEKRAFLKKKGLTDQEISAAEARVPQQSPTTTAATPPPLPPRTLTPALPPPQPRSWSELALMFAVVGGVSYALIHFVKSYVVPWLTAPRVQEKKLEDIHASVDQLHSTVNQTIASLAESNKSVKDLLSEQQQHIQLLTTQVAGLQASLTQQSHDQPLRQLKEELGSLKGILLSRHQFPPTPTRGGVANGGGAAGIPVWQRSTPGLASLESSATPVKGPVLYQEQSSPPSEEVKGKEMSEGRTILQNGEQKETETVHNSD